MDISDSFFYFISFLLLLLLVHRLKQECFWLWQWSWKKKKDRKKIARNPDMEYVCSFLQVYLKHNGVYSSICCLSGYGYANKLEFRWLIRLCYRMQFIFRFHNKRSEALEYHEHTCTQWHFKCCLKFTWKSYFI